AAPARLLLNARTHTRTHTLPYTTLFRSRTSACTDICALACTTEKAAEIRAAWEIRLAVWKSGSTWYQNRPLDQDVPLRAPAASRSEEHTSELQSRGHLVCRRLLVKKYEI